LMTFSAFASAIERALVSIDSLQAPTRVKMCDGICGAWYASGAVLA
jgi:hypothetical protein